MRAVGAEQRRNIGLAELRCQPLAAQQALAGTRQPLGLIEPAACVVLRQLIATAQQRRAGAGQRAQQQRRRDSSIFMMGYPLCRSRNGR